MTQLTNMVLIGYLFPLASASFRYNTGIIDG